MKHRGTLTSICGTEADDDPHLLDKAAKATVISSVSRRLIPLSCRLPIIASPLAKKHN